MAFTGGTEMSRPVQALVVDDEEHVRTLFCAVLADLGCRCREASDGQRALEQMKRFPADLVLLDMVMPVKSGLETLKELLTLWPETVVVVVTVAHDLDLVVESMRAGAYDYITKPLDLQALGQRVSQALERRHHRWQSDLFRNLCESSPFGIYIVQRGRFQFVNPQFQRSTGYSEGELLGRECLALVCPEDKEAVRENALMMLRGRRSSPYQYCIVNKGGETRWIMETVASVQYQGKRATLGNFVDISNLKRREQEELLLRQQLAERHKEEEQRVRELTALNRMFQERLSLWIAVSETAEELARGHSAWRAQALEFLQHLGGEDQVAFLTPDSKLSELQQSLQSLLKAADQLAPILDKARAPDHREVG